MIPLQSIFRPSNLCALRSIIYRGIHLQSKLAIGPYKSNAAQGMPQWTQDVSVACLNLQEKSNYLNSRLVRSFSTNPDSKLVHLLDSDNKAVQKVTLKKANIIAQKEGMKLFRVRKNRSQDGMHVEEYKLLSEADFKKAVSKDKEEHKEEKFKEFSIGVHIHDNDLKMKLKIMRKNLLKGSRIKLMLSSEGFSSTARKNVIEGKVKADAEHVVATCLEEFKDIARVTNVVKGNKTYVYEFEAVVKNPTK